MHPVWIDEVHAERVVRLVLEQLDELAAGNGARNHEFRADADA
jgi:hypothetical protein